MGHFRRKKSLAKKARSGRGQSVFTWASRTTAAERWVKGCFEADMAMIAEKVMTIDELKKFCDKHFPIPVLLEDGIDFLNYEKDTYNPLKRHEELNFILRNLLARRLMRAGRFKEACSYFTGVHTREQNMLYLPCVFFVINRNKTLFTIASLQLSVKQQLFTFGSDELKYPFSPKGAAAI